MAYLLTRQDSGRSAVGVAFHRVFELEVRDPENMASEKDQGVEGLFLGGNRNPAIEDEVIEKIGNGGWACRLWGFAEVLEAESSESCIPVDVCLLGGVGKAAKPCGTTDFVSDASNFFV